MENRTKLLWASFLTLIAAGVGFAIRGGILGDWGAEYGFTKGELGNITGGGLVGFGYTILVCSLIVDRVGYKPLMLLAFTLHVLSAVVTLAATPVFNQFGKGAAYQCLYWGMFMFALANGVCESVINPLVATLYPKQKTHYLNILHAGWPGGLVLGGLFAYFFCGPTAAAKSLQWEIPMAVFLIPTLMYGFFVIKEKFPVSEAAAAGVPFGEMLKCFASPVLIFLLLLHAMIGYVELGTDSWITNIMDNVIGNYAFLLFVYTSALMFVLRFFAGPIVEHINPVGLLVVSAILGCLGLYWLGSSSQSALTLNAETGQYTFTTLTTALGATVVAAATIYALGKTFLWPTILGVVGERFPKGGALVMGAMGGVGMLSAGYLGGPGIGYKQDYYASKNLQEVSKPTYERYASTDDNRFLFFPAIFGLDGTKVATLGDDGKDLGKRVENTEKEGKKVADDKNLAALVAWWDTAKDSAESDKGPIKAANVFGGCMALKWTAVVPLSMAIGFGLLFCFFAATGGYKQVELHEVAEATEKASSY